MKNVKRIVIMTLIIGMLTMGNVSAENGVEYNVVAVDTSQAEAEIEGMINEIDELLLGNNPALEQKADEVLKKNSDNWFVKLFQRIFAWFENFLAKVLNFAGDAAKVGP